MFISTHDLVRKHGPLILGVILAVSVGMGLLFTEMARSQRPVLERWFAELRGDSPPEPPVVERNGQGAQAAALEGGERYAIEDLVILLTQRHVLTEDEGESILRRMTE